MGLLKDSHKFLQTTRINHRKRLIGKKVQDLGSVKPMQTHLNQSPSNLIF